ncbi:hypothetical protein [Cysteiniphilum halobium]|uniref:hypothetical protein n=1 Tax=Cysteiniphilum halobium TaxID=2219059 RepID=UPI003F86D4A1
MRIYSYALKSLLYFLSLIFISCFKLAFADLPSVTLYTNQLKINQPTVISSGVLDLSSTPKFSLVRGINLCHSGHYTGGPKTRYRVAPCFSPYVTSMFNCLIKGYKPIALSSGVQGKYMQVPGIPNLYFNISLKTISDGTFNLEDNDDHAIAQGEFNVSSYIPKGNYTNIINPPTLTLFANDSSPQVDSVKDWTMKNPRVYCISGKHDYYTANYFITGQKIGYKVTVVATGPLAPGTSDSSTIGISSAVYSNTDEGSNDNLIQDFGQKLTFLVIVPDISCSISAAPSLNTTISADTLQNIYNGKPQDLFGTTNIILNCNNPYSMQLSNNVAVYLSQATGQVGTDGNYVPLLSDSSGNRITQKPFVYAVYNSKGVKQIAQSTPPTTFTKHLHLCDFDPLIISGSGEAPVQHCPFTISLLKNPAATAADKDAIKNISTISGTLNFKVAIE